MKKSLITSLLAIAVVLGLSACAKDADVASKNLSTASDMFEIDRRIVFYNGITGEYMLVLEGLCALGNNDKPGQLSVTCKTGHAAYKKHYLGLSDNVTYFVEQLESKGVNVYHYRVVFKPQSILSDIDLRGDAEALINK